MTALVLFACGVLIGTLTLCTVAVAVLLSGVRGGD